MDAETRARYKAWMLKKIIRKLAIPVALIFILIIAIIMGLRSCTTDDDNLELVNETECSPADETCEIESDDETDSDDEHVAPVIAREPTYEDFDFTVYDDDAIILQEDDLSSPVILVNRVFSLPADFSPEKLRAPNVLGVWQAENTLLMEASAATALERLFEAAFEDEGLEFWIVSGYRSFENQTTRHQNFIYQHGIEEAERMSMRPGHCEHQTGLAATVTAASVGAELIEEFSNVTEGIWLRENAHRFGFIIRYPAGKIHITGTRYEPWHIRYVGQSVAGELFANGLVLEQYVLPLPRWEQP